jgi:hypothetical protein
MKKLIKQKSSILIKQKSSTISNMSSSTLPIKSDVYKKRIYGCKGMKYKKEQ